MRKLLILSLALIALSSCGPTTLYYWGEDFSNTYIYDQITYRNYKNQTPQSICAMVAGYEEIINYPGGMRGVIPPGVCAEYGYLLLLPTTAEYFEKYATSGQRRLFTGSDYGNLFMEKGKELLQKEVELYPESAVFIMPLIKNIK
ncbi:MAG: DUF4810 domain-containing protein [Bacteroidales bacterium]|nr:DUF4810 domain-containing protein [Bacteroidales bacterium]